ncbi:MAG: TIGR04552 family protein [Deltaproteobacteria bacterium]|nr:TIGR04552 family protein [Deltaproteobacteria bacterium]
MTLSLAQLEQVRLILRGGSVVDWYRLRFDSLDDVRGFLALQGGDLDDPADLARLEHLRGEAARYLTDEHGYKVPPELLSCDAVDLFLFASERRGRRRDRFFACLLLKVMHIVHHIEARELAYRLPLSQAALFDLLVDKVDVFAARLQADGFPLVRYTGGQKSTTSLLTKLLVKKEHHAAAIHDRVRFRFVVRRTFDLVELLARMTRELFPFNYVAPAQTVNHLVNFTAFVESQPAYRAWAADLQLELGEEDQALRPLNEFSGPSYAVINFVVDVPLRIPDAALSASDASLGRVVFALAEFQIVDEVTDDQNEVGENRHDRYRARQLGIVRERLERGKRGARDDA